jgi:hypothetical protein
MKQNYSRCPYCGNKLLPLLTDPQYINCGSACNLTLEIVNNQIVFWSVNLKLNNLVYRLLSNSGLSSDGLKSFTKIFVQSDEIYYDDVFAGDISLMLDTWYPIQFKNFVNEANELLVRLLNLDVFY